MDVIYLMSLFGYYHRFSDGFSKITYTSTSFQKKRMKFEWSQGCEESFQPLKKIITNAPILKLQIQKNIFWFASMHALIRKQGTYRPHVSSTWIFSSNKI
jgi:hypothetical protein